MDRPLDYESTIVTLVSYPYCAEPVGSHIAGGVNEFVNMIRD